MPQASRSPIKKPLLKLPGQDADEDLQNFVEDQLLAPLLVLLMIASMCLSEWLHYWNNSPPSPWIYTVWFLGSLLVIGYHWRKQWKIAKAKKLGRDGERAIAEFINVRLTTDARALHNVPIDGGIADHLLICRQGLFAIETKTRSFPTRGAPVVHVGDQGLRVGGFWPDRDPIAQVQRYVTGLQRILKAENVTAPVEGIVVFPGWEVVDDRASPQTIAVLNPRQLDKFLQSKPECLSPEQISRLTKYVARLSRPAPAT